MARARLLDRVGPLLRMYRKSRKGQEKAIAGVLNHMLEEGRLIRRRKDKRKVLWSLAEDGNQERMQSEGEGIGDVVEGIGDVVDLVE